MIAGRGLPPYLSAMSEISAPIGPVLYLDHIADGVMHQSALFIMPKGDAPAPIVTDGAHTTPKPLAEFDRATVWRARFTRPADRPSSYRWNGMQYDIAGDLTGDLRLAYVSCNGEEIGDMNREGSERNAMWARLCDEHSARRSR